MKNNINNIFISLQVFKEIQKLPKRFPFKEDGLIRRAKCLYEERYKILLNQNINKPDYYF